MKTIAMLLTVVEPEPFAPGFPEYFIFLMTTAIILLIYQIKRVVGNRRAAERAAQKDGKPDTAGDGEPSATPP